MKVILAVCVVAIVIGYNLIDNFNPSVLKGKRVLVTGASTGIGEQIAYHYARLGANVVLVARREARLKEVAQKCFQLSGKDATHDYIAADMGDLEKLESVTQQVLEKLGGTIDILVLNHAISPSLALWHGSSENMTTLDQVIDINFKSYVRLSSYFLPHLEKTDGQLIVLSSSSGKVAQPYLLHYVSSKFSVEGFFGGLRQELYIKQSKISVTVCVIGATATENNFKNMREFGLNFFIDYHLGGTPEDTAMAIVRGGALREREVFYQLIEIWPTVVLRGFIPSWFEAINRFVFSCRST